MRPLLARQALSHIRGTVEEGLEHEATRWVQETIRAPNGEYETTPHWDNAVFAHLISDAAKVAEIAAARGVEATYLVKYRLGEAVTPGEVWRVTAEDDDGTEYVKLVRLTSVEPLKRLAILATAVDTTLNQPAPVT